MANSHVMYRRAEGWGQPSGEQARVAVRCPFCGQRGVFELVGSDVAVQGDQGSFFVGHRRCPDPECHGLIYVGSSSSGLVSVYPRELLALDRAGIPSEILECLDEALASHAARCFRAAAMMVRRSLEVLCEKNGAKGGTLMARLEALGDKAVISPALKKGLTHLRLLGNDAAHVDARDYSQIGDEEVTLAIDVTREILEAVYQHADLVARLEALKEGQPGS